MQNECEQADTLAKSHTAHELAGKLVGLRIGFLVKTRQAEIAFSTLNAIKRGEFTEQGAHEEAAKAVKRMLDEYRN